MGNIFEKAKTAVAPAKKAGKKDEKRRVAMKGLEPYAIVVSLSKNLETIQETLKAELHTLMKAEFLEHANGKRPENFRGFEGDAEGSMEMRKRTTTAKLTPEEKAALDEHNIPYGTEEALPERYFFNPEILADPKLMQKISKALESVPGLPENVILLQKSDPTYVVTDETVETVFKNGHTLTKDGQKLAAKFMGMVTTLAIKPTMTEQNITKSLDQVKELLSAKKEKATADLRAALKKSVTS